MVRRHRTCLLGSEVRLASTELVGPGHGMLTGMELEARKLLVGGWHSSVVAPGKEVRRSSAVSCHNRGTHGNTGVL